MSGVWCDSRICDIRKKYLNLGVVGTHVAPQTGTTGCPGGGKVGLYRDSPPHP